MGMFDFFSNEERGTSRTNTSRDFNTRENANVSTINNNPVAVFSPKSFEDVSSVIDCLKSGKTSVVHFNDLKSDTAVRVLDMLSGAIYALDGGVYEVEKNVFMFTKNGVEIK